jgi:hypothetical protein
VGVTVAVEPGAPVAASVAVELDAVGDGGIGADAVALASDVGVTAAAVSVASDDRVAAAEVAVCPMACRVAADGGPIPRRPVSVNGR